MIVLVCGGRNYGVVPKNMVSTYSFAVKKAALERGLLNDTLDEWKVDGKVTAVIQGGASGADNLALKWAERNMLPCHTFNADWFAYGKGAGPIRNKRMLDEGKPDVVLAFPGGTGTENMKKLAKEAGVKVVEI